MQYLDKNLEIKFDKQELIYSLFITVLYIIIYIREILIVVESFNRE